MMQYKTPKKSKKRSGIFIKVIKILLIGIIFGAFLVAGVSIGFVTALVKDDPVRSSDEIINKVFKNNLTGFAYFSNNDQTENPQLIGMLRADEDRRFVQFKEIPEYFYNAVLAVEDSEFKTHLGVNFKAFSRAVLQQVLNSDVRTGGSTITQQLVKNTFYSFEKSYERKFKEIFLALRIERILSKEAIFTAYANKINFGKAANLNNVYGIQAAAKGYFNKNSKELNLAESAFLAGIPQRPNAYSSFDSTGFDEDGYKLAKERQKLVLKRMLEISSIDQQEYNEALAYDINAAFDTTQVQKKAYNKYPYLMLEIEDRAAEKLVESKGISIDDDDYSKILNDMKLDLLTGGYKVYTSIDQNIYETMNSVVENSENFYEPIDYTFPLANGKSLEFNDALEQVGATLIQNKTGAILGFVGGRDFDINQVNHSNFRGGSKRQPGSSIKPILDYGPALELGKIQPASPIDDIPLGTKWEPENWNSKYNGRITAREALNWSFNIPAVKVYDLVGQVEGYNFLTKLGFNVDETFFKRAGLTPAIGTIETSPEEMANAFIAFPNEGTYVDAYLIDRIIDKDGNIVYEHQSNPEIVFSEQTAYLMTDMLRTVINNGTGGRVLKFLGYEIDIAGKTGTTNDDKDSWFIGYTPEVTLGVWVGYDYPHELEKSSISSKIWGEILAEVLKVDPELSPLETKFERPSNLVKMEVSSTSGKLPSELTKEAGYLVTDWFNKEFMPTKIDDSLEIARVITFNGKRYLAKEETPEDMIDTGIFFKREPYELPYVKDKETDEYKTDDEGNKIKKAKPVDYDKELPNDVDPRNSTGEAPLPPNLPIIKLQGIINSLSWDKNLDENVIGYRIYRTSATDFSFEKIGSVKQTDLEPERLYFEDEQVDEYKAYAYYITAVDIANLESSPSEIIGNLELDPIELDTPEEGDGDSIFDDIFGEGNNGIGDDQTQNEIDTQFTEKPSTPQNLNAKRSEIGIEVLLTWTDNPSEEAITKYNIFYSEDNSSFKLIGSTKGTKFTHFTANPGFYYITAINKSGQSSRSDLVHVNNN